MLKHFFGYYLFDYEIKVYPKYTTLSDEMIKEKMRHFSQVLMEDDNRILGIIACFYDENGEKVYKCKSTLSNEVTSFDSDPLVKKYSDGKWKILVMPYYLFENQEVTNLKGQMDKENMDLYKAYEKYEKLPEFIWSKPLPKPAENISDALNKLEEASEKFKNVMGHGKAYQKLYCLIVFNKDESIDDVLYADPFALTIKEWGLDILHNEIIKHATKSAVTAIMARNISHNIGSHVITYWNAHLKGILFPSADWDNESKWFAMPNYSILAFENKYPNVINQSRNLLQYVQQRMDFIADISTTTPSSELSMNFKHDIMHTITGDDGNKQNKHGNLEPLLKHIAQSESYTQIRINTDECPDDIYVSIPNSVVGSHAIYSILENFIRNAAKHFKGIDGITVVQP